MLTCDECGVQDETVKDLGHTILCLDCKAEDDYYYRRETDYQERMTERRQMGLTNF